VGLDPLSPDWLSPLLQSLVALRHDLIAQAKAHA
jgi:hypothetical protein